MNVVLFDIDGTLLASGGAGKAALETALCEEFQVELCFEVPYSGRTDRAIVRDLFHHHKLDYSDENCGKLQRGYLKRLPDCLVKNQGRVLPGIDNLLAKLRQRPDVVLGLLTGNVRAGAEVKLGHFGIHEHFRLGGFGDLHFDRDDVAREALAEIRAQVGEEIKPEQIFVIGDTPLDVRCARAIGAKAVAVATGAYSVADLQATGADLVVADLSDASEFLKMLM